MNLLHHPNNFLRLGLLFFPICRRGNRGMHDPPKVTHAVEPELEPRELNSRIYALLTEETK